MIRKSEIGRNAIKGDKHVIDGSITTEKLKDLAVKNAKIDDATITAAKLSNNNIKIVEEFSLISCVQEVGAAAKGTPTFPHSVNILRDETIENVKDAKAILDFEWGGTADGRLQIYDETNGVVLAETAGLTGGETDDDLILSIAVADLKAGARIICRANITGAGASGEVSKIHRCFIKVVRGYS